MISMFLRFYNQTDENIDRCIEELRGRGNKITKVTKKPLTQSYNVMVPEGKHTEVLIYFSTKTEVDAFYNDPTNKEIYDKYAMADDLRKYSTGVVRRKQKDIAFGV
jgi:uncharacterized protein (DUF1330 family)